VRIRKMGAALALGGALAVSGLAIAGPASAATTGGVKPAAWTYADVSFTYLPDCQRYGQSLETTGQAQAYQCIWDDNYAMFDLYIYVS
jgi:hypothetical protein